jgi:hypothetical protein
MSKIQIQLTGIGAELALGNYMPNDTTIFQNWEEFFHYNNLVHNSLLLTEHISEIEIKQDDAVIFKGKIPASQFIVQKGFTPKMENEKFYLRTECAEQAIYCTEFEVDNFDKMKLYFETQDYDLLFKVGNSFLAKIAYEGKPLELSWISGKPVGNICLLCTFSNGFLVPKYDAIKKTGSI